MALIPNQILFCSLFCLVTKKVREKLENLKREFDEAHILFHHRMNAITMPLYSNV